VSEDQGFAHVVDKKWISKPEGSFGTLQPELKSCDLGGKKITIYPVRLSRFESAGIPFLPIIWVPQFLLITGDPLKDDHGVLKISLAPFSQQDVKILIGEKRIPSKRVVSVKTKSGEDVFFYIPDEALGAESLPISIVLNGEEKQIMFEKENCFSWYPIIVPL